MLLVLVLVQLEINVNMGNMGLHVMIFSFHPAALISKRYFPCLKSLSCTCSPVKKLIRDPITHIHFQEIIFLQEVSLIPYPNYRNQVSHIHDDKEIRLLQKADCNPVT